MILFNWRHADGTITNWWNGSLDHRTQFVYNHFKSSTSPPEDTTFSIAIDFRRRAAQAFFDMTGERHVISLDEIPPGSDFGDALAALVDLHERQAIKLAAELLMRHLGRDDLADIIERDT